MKKNHKILIAILSICLIATLSIGGTIAFLTDNDEKTNTFKVGNLDITLTEPNWTDTKGENLLPGKTMVKDPTVTEDLNDGYVRIIMTITDSSDNKITDADRLALILETIRFDSTYNSATPTVGTGLVEGTKYSRTQLAAFPTVNPNFEKVDAKSSAGEYYYNYKNILEDDQKAVLFTNVVIPTDWDNADLAKAGNFKIVLKAEAIQSDSFANATEAFAALDAEIAKSNP